MHRQIGSILVLLLAAAAAPAQIGGTIESELEFVESPQTGNIWDADFDAGVPGSSGPISAAVGPGEEFTTAVFATTFGLDVSAPDRVAFRINTGAGSGTVEIGSTIRLTIRGVTGLNGFDLLRNDFDATVEITGLLDDLVITLPATTELQNGQDNIFELDLSYSGEPDPPTTLDGDSIEGFLDIGDGTNLFTDDPFTSDFVSAVVSPLTSEFDVDLDFLGAGATLNAFADLTGTQIRVGFLALQPIFAGLDATFGEIDGRVLGARVVESDFPDVALSVPNINTVRIVTGPVTTMLAGDTSVTIQVILERTLFIAGDAERVVPEDEPLVLTTEGFGLENASYRWARDNMPLSDGDGISGSATETLTIAAASAETAGVYTARATPIDRGAFVFSDPVSVVVAASPPNGDYNRDGTIDFFDVLDLILDIDGTQP